VGHARSGRYEFICQDGQLYGDQIHGFTQAIRHSSVATEEQLEQVPTILPLLADWAAFLESGRDNPVSGDDGLYAVKVCDSCLQSAAENRWIEV
jgi:predicted dehydrogenase